eukprot:TRINITY_DN1182_c0_g1_i1.p1 TRINITY_DN1182_c0_g1~~TRINITY_DN1182_c0_g1_i1.p1  ORF type:complete len:233 (-),score=98.31 TRINITY_DN1182_c0_g1_i1:123-782(-)
MDEFLSLESQFTRSISSANDALRNYNRAYSEDEKHTAATTAVRHQQEAKNLLKRMDETIRFYPEISMSVSAKIRRYTNDLTYLDSQLDSVKRSTLFDSNNTYGGATPDDPFAERQMQQKQLLEGHGKRIDKMDNQIDRLIAIGEDTVQTGVAAHDLLKDQTGRLRGANDDLYVIDEKISQSNRIMRSMYFNVIGNKIVLIVIIFLELVALGAVIYFRAT